MIHNRPLIALLFDVDGVLTDPGKKQVTQEVIFEKVNYALKSGLPVTLNTGRSIEWVKERFIKPLGERVDASSLLGNFFAVGEKGLTWASFEHDGNVIEGVFDREGNTVRGFDLSVFFEEDTVAHFIRLEREVKNLIESRYAHSTFYDSTKKAMISTEMHDGFDQTRYTAQQPAFTKDLYLLLEKEHLSDKFRIDPTTIATDIQIPAAGKHLGAKRILNWLSNKGFAPLHFATLGDSSSDLEMADELNEQGKSVDFWYVNPQKPLNIEKPYSIKTTKNAFEKGTLEALDEIFQAL